MKRLLIIALLVCTLLIMLTVIAYADDTASGIYDLQTQAIAGLTISVKPAGTDAVINSPTTYKYGESNIRLYPDAVKIQVSITGAPEGTQLLILAQNADAAPTKDNICYINQDASDADGAVTFTVYPSALEGYVAEDEGPVYHLFIAGHDDNGKTEIASFKYLDNGAVSALLGDVNLDKAVNSIDALYVLQYAAHSRDLTNDQLLAADVNLDNAVNSIDALWILQYAAHSRTF